MDKILFNEPVGIYIGNNCNLSCEQCLTFSNFNFKKWFRWDSFQDYYIEWSNKVDYKNIYIFGGEPYANPELKEWAVNLKKLWPESNFWILTNGSYIRNHIQLTRDLMDVGYIIQISCKDDNFFNEANEIVPLLFDDNKNIIKIRDKDTISRPYTNNYITKFYQNSKVVIEIYEDYYFIPSSIKEIKDGILYFHKNDAESTHASCPVIPCNVLLNGLFYKCSFMSAFSEAKHQFKFEKSAFDLLEKYQPGSPYDNIDDFFKNYKKFIPQCSLCNYNNMNIKESIIKLFPRKSKTKLG